MYNKPLYSTENGLRFDRHYVVKPILNKLNIGKLFDIRANLWCRLKKCSMNSYHEEFHTVALLCDRL